jgi:hypothetical protein
LSWALRPRLVDAAADGNAAAFHLLDLELLETMRSVSLKLSNDNRKERRQRADLSGLGRLLRGLSGLRAQRGLRRHQALRSRRSRRCGRRLVRCRVEAKLVVAGRLAFGNELVTSCDRVLLGGNLHQQQSTALVRCNRANSATSA